MGNRHYFSPQPQKIDYDSKQYVNVSLTGPYEEQVITQRIEPKRKKKRHLSTRGDIPNG